MKRKTYLITYTERQESSGHPYRFGSAQKHTWNAAVKECLAIVRSRFLERGTPYSETYKEFSRTDGRFTHGKWGWNTAYDVRLDFELTLIEE